MAQMPFGRADIRVGLHYKVFCFQRLADTYRVISDPLVIFAQLGHQRLFASFLRFLVFYSSVLDMAGETIQILYRAGKQSCTQVIGIILVYFIR